MNEAKYLQDAINQIWPDLPALLGDEWPPFSQKLQQFLDELAVADTAVAALSVCDEIFDHFYGHSAANARLHSVLSEESTSALAPAKGLDMSDPAMESFSPFDPVADETDTVTRYTDIELPTQVQVDDRFPVIVGLTVAASPDSADAQAVDARLGAQIFCMVTPGPDLEVLNQRMQPLTVLDGDSQPVIFYLRATAAGERQVQIDFLYDGQIVASSTQTIQAGDDATTATPGWRAGPPIGELRNGASHPAGGTCHDCDSGC